MVIFGCETAQSYYKQPNCLSTKREKARVRQLAAVDDDAEIDESTPDLFASTLLTAERNCQATILRSISGALNDPTPITAPGYGDQQEEEIGQTNVIEFTDPLYMLEGRIDYYNSLKERMATQTIYFMTDTQAHKIQLGKASLAHRKSIPGDTTADAVGIITISWSEDKVSTPISINRDTLKKEPPLVVDPSALAFANVGASSADITNSGSTITETEDTAFEVALDMGVTLGSAVVKSGTLPTGVVLVIDPTNEEQVLISGTVATPVTRKITLELANPCGINSLYEVTINITAA